jgi:hypothetical protein
VKDREKGEKKEKRKEISIERREGRGLGNYHPGFILSFCHS